MRAFEPRGVLRERVLHGRHGDLRGADRDRRGHGGTSDRRTSRNDHPQRVDALYVLLWQIEAPFVLWAVVSVLIGLGFTFFSGATEAWLVDALTATGYTGELETVFGRGQIVAGVAMLVGSVAGGFIAQRTSLGSLSSCAGSSLS